MQLAEILLDGDIVVLAMPEIAGLPYVVSGLIAAGGLAAALSTADGLLLTMVDQSLGEVVASAPDQIAAIERFAAGCGVDLPHLQHVGRLAVSLYRQLQPVYGWPADDERLLQAAALLRGRLRSRSSALRSSGA